MNHEKYIDNAKKSKFGLWKLNLFLSHFIPFNKPHGIVIKNISDYSIETIIPYKRKNLNHIKGVHACGMATCAEFASGFLLISKLGFKNYRLIMESIEVKYHYQAKTDIIAYFEITKNWLDNDIIIPIKNEGVVFIKCEIKLYSTSKNHVATAYTNWQIKDWKKVKTKV
ncbi:MAG TPA: DUF4442 domain-containing protein [Crocinitomix sp.]|nr:DUF4442 domain-containing protein [Crocinitomix sp.]